MGGFGEGKGKEIDTYTENKNKEKKSTPLLKYVAVYTTLKLSVALCILGPPYDQLETEYYMFLYCGSQPKGYYNHLEFIYLFI